MLFCEVRDPQFPLAPSSAPSGYANPVYTPGTYTIRASVEYAPRTSGVIDARQPADVLDAALAGAGVGAFLARVLFWSTSLATLDGAVTRDPGDGGACLQRLAEAYPGVGDDDRSEQFAKISIAPMAATLSCDPGPAGTPPRTSLALILVAAVAVAIGALWLLGSSR